MELCSVGEERPRSGAPAGAQTLGFSGILAITAPDRRRRLSEGPNRQQSRKEAELPDGRLGKLTLMQPVSTAAPGAVHAQSRAGAQLPPAV